MDVEKMREEFEFAYVADLVARCGEGFRETALYSLSERKSDGSYQHYTDSIAWWAWQASRATLVIELPDDGIEDCQKAWGTERCKDTFDCGYNFASLRHEQAIEASGLKVK
jgi:hypothetical protein